MPAQTAHGSKSLLPAILPLLLLIFTIFTPHSVVQAAICSPQSNPSVICASENECCDQSTGLIRNADFLIKQKQYYCTTPSTPPTNVCSSLCAPLFTLTGCNVGCGLLICGDTALDQGAFCVDTTSQRYGRCNASKTCVPFTTDWHYSCSSECQCASQQTTGFFPITSTQCRSTSTNAVEFQNINLPGNCTTTPVTQGDSCTCPNWKCLKKTVSPFSPGTVLTPDQYVPCDTSVASLITDSSSEYAAQCGNGNLSFSPQVAAQCFTDHLSPRILCISPDGIVMDDSKCAHMTRPHLNTTPACTVTTGCTYGSFLCSAASSPNQSGATYEACSADDLVKHFDATCVQDAPLALEANFQSISSCDGHNSRYVYCVQSTSAISGVVDITTLAWAREAQCNALGLTAPARTRRCELCTYQWGCSKQLSLPASGTTNDITTCATYDAMGSSQWYNYLTQFSCLDELVPSADGKRSVGCFASIRNFLAPAAWDTIQHLVRTSTTSLCSSTTPQPPTTQTCPTDGQWMCRNDDTTYSSTCHTNTIQSRCTDAQNPTCSATAVAPNLPFECRIASTTVLTKYCIAAPPATQENCIIDHGCQFQWRCISPTIPLASLTPATILTQTQLCALPMVGIDMYSYVAPSQGDSTTARLNADNFITKSQYLHLPSHPLWSQCTSSGPDAGCGVGVQSTNIVCVNADFKTAYETYTASSPISTSVSSTTRCDTNSIPLYNTIPCVTTTSCPGVGYYCAKMPVLTLTETALITKYLEFESAASTTDFTVDIMSSFPPAEQDLITQLYSKVNFRDFIQCTSAFVPIPSSLSPSPSQPIVPFYDELVAGFNDECIGQCTDLSTNPPTSGLGQRSRQTLCLAPSSVTPPISQQTTPTPNPIKVYLDNPTSVLQSYTNPAQLVHPLFTNNAAQSTLCKYVLGYNPTTFAAQAAYIGPLSFSTASTPLPAPNAPAYHTQITPILPPQTSLTCPTLPCTLVCRPSTSDSTAIDITTYSKCLQTPSSLSTDLDGEYPYVLPQNNAEITTSPANPRFATFTFPSFPLNIYNSNSLTYSFISQAYYEQYFYQQFLCQINGSEKAANRLQQCFDYNINPTTLQLVNYRSTGSISQQNNLFVSSRGYFNSKGCANTIPQSIRDATPGLPPVDPDIPPSVPCFSRQFHCKVPQIQTRRITNRDQGTSEPTTINSYDYDCSQPFLTLYDSLPDPIEDNSSRTLSNDQPICQYLASLPQYQAFCVNIPISLSCTDESDPGLNLSYDRCLLSLPSTLTTTSLQCSTSVNCVCPGTAIAATPAELALNIAYSYQFFTNGPDCNQSPQFIPASLKLTLQGSPQPLNVSKLIPKEEYELIWGFQGNFQQRGQVFLVSATSSTTSSTTPQIQHILYSFTTSTLLANNPDTATDALTRLTLSMPSLSELESPTNFQLTSSTPLYVVLYMDSTKFLFSPVTLSYTSYCESIIGTADECGVGYFCVEYTASCEAFTSPTLSTLAPAKITTPYPDYAPINASNQDLFDIDQNQIYVGDFVRFSFDFQPNSLPSLISSASTTGPPTNPPVYNAYIELYTSITAESSAVETILSRNLVSLQTGTNSFVMTIPNIPTLTSLASAYKNVFLRVVLSYQNSYYNLPNPLTTSQFSHVITKSATPATIYPYCASFVNKMACLNISGSKLNFCSRTALSSTLPPFSPASIPLATTTSITSLPTSLPQYPIAVNSGTATSVTYVAIGCLWNPPTSPQLTSLTIEPALRNSNYVVYPLSEYQVKLTYTSDVSKLYDAFHRPAPVTLFTLTSNSVLPTPNANKPPPESPTELDTIESFAQIRTRYFPSNFFPIHTLSTTMFSASLPTETPIGAQYPTFEGSLDPYVVLNTEVVQTNPATPQSWANAVSLGSGNWRLTLDYAPLPGPVAQYLTNFQFSLTDPTFHTITATFPTSWTVQPWCSSQGNFVSCIEGKLAGDGTERTTMPICSNTNLMCETANLSALTDPLNPGVPVTPDIPTSTLDILLMQRKLMTCEQMRGFLGYPAQSPDFIPVCSTPGTLKCVVLFIDGIEESSTNFPLQGMCICNDGFTGDTCELPRSSVSCPSSSNVAGFEPNNSAKNSSRLSHLAFRSFSGASRFHPQQSTPVDFHDANCKCISGYSAFALRNLPFPTPSSTTIPPATTYNQYAAKLVELLQTAPVLNAMLYFASLKIGLNPAFLTITPSTYPTSLDSGDTTTQQAVILQLKANFPCIAQQYLNLDYSAIEFNPSTLTPAEPPPVNIQKLLMTSYWDVLKTTLIDKLESIDESPIKPTSPPWSSTVTLDDLGSYAFEEALYLVLTQLVDEVINGPQDPSSGFLQLFQAGFAYFQSTFTQPFTNFNQVPPQPVVSSIFSQQSLADQVSVSELSFSPCATPDCGTVVFQQPSTGSDSSSISSTMLVIIIVVVVVGVLLLIAIAIAIFCCYRSSKCCFSKEEKERPPKQPKPPKQPRQQKDLTPAESSNQSSDKFQPQIEVSRLDALPPATPESVLSVKLQPHKERNQSVSHREEVEELSVSHRSLNDIFTPPEAFSVDATGTPIKGASLLQQNQHRPASIGGINMSNNADFLNINNQRPSTATAAAAAAGSYTDEFGLLVTPGFSQMITPSLGSPVLNHHHRPGPRRGGAVRRQLVNLHQSIINQATSMGITPIPLSYILPSYSHNAATHLQSVATVPTSDSHKSHGSALSSLYSDQSQHSVHPVMKVSAQHPAVEKSSGPKSSLPTYLSLLNHPVFMQQLNYDYGASSGSRSFQKSPSFASHVSRTRRESVSVANYQPSRMSYASVGSRRSRGSKRSIGAKSLAGSAHGNQTNHGIKANIKTPTFDSPTPIPGHSSNTNPHHVNSSAVRSQHKRRPSISVSKNGFTSINEAPKSRIRAPPKRLSTHGAADDGLPQRPRQKSRHGSISINGNGPNSMFAQFKGKTSDNPDNAGPNPGDSDEDGSEIYDMFDDDDNDEGCIDNYSSDDDDGNYDDGAIIEGEEHSDRDGVIYAASISRRNKFDSRNSKAVSVSKLSHSKLSKTSKTSKGSKASKSSKHGAHSSNPNDVVINFLHTVPDGDEEEDHEEEVHKDPLLMSQQNVVSGSGKGASHQYGVFTPQPATSIKSKPSRRTNEGGHLGPGLVRSNSSAGSVVSRVGPVSHVSQVSRISRVSHASRISQRPTGPIGQARQQRFEVQQKLIYSMDRPLLPGLPKKKPGF